MFSLIEELKTIKTILIIIFFATRFSWIIS